MQLWQREDVGLMIYLNKMRKDMPPSSLKRKERDLINDASKEGNIINVFGRSLFGRAICKCFDSFLRWHFFFFLSFLQDELSFIPQNGIILAILRIRETSIYFLWRYFQLECSYN